MKDKKPTVPEKNSREWIRNEKIINENPALRAARDVSEGFRPRAGGAGKGDSLRPMSISKAEFAENWERIFGKRDQADDSDS